MTFFDTCLAIHLCVGFVCASAFVLMFHVAHEEVKAKEWFWGAALLVLGLFSAGLMIAVLTSDNNTPRTDP